MFCEPVEVAVAVVSDCLGQVLICCLIEKWRVKRIDAWLLLIFAGFVVCLVWSAC